MLVLSLQKPLTARTVQQSNKEALALLARGLKEGAAPRDSRTVGNNERITYCLKAGYTITFDYDGFGNPLKLGGVMMNQRPGEVVPMVSAGFDPLPYVDLNASEQRAAVGGVASTLAGAICLALGPETAGVGCAVAGGLAATIISIAASNGVCPDGQTMRIYILVSNVKCLG